LQAHTLGAKNCLTLIHRADYASAISSSGRHFGIMAAVSPREATRREIERFLTSDRFHLLKRFGGGELIEIRINKGAIASGHQIAEVAWQAGCVLVSHMMELHAAVLGPESLLEAGDLVYSMVAPQSLKVFVNLLD